MPDPTPTFTPAHRQLLDDLAHGAFAVLHPERAEAMAAALARIDELSDEAARLERRRGGECQQCGRWVCPPLTCMGCLAGLEPEEELRRTNAELTGEVERLGAGRDALLAACREMLDSMEDVVANFGGDYSESAAEQHATMLRAAIAQAEGTTDAAEEPATDG